MTRILSNTLTQEEKAFYKVMIEHAALFVDSNAHLEIIAAFERAVAQAKTPGLAAGGVTICKRCGGQVSPASPPE
jgi:hypothetical protein